jgi:hypothetical protein
MNCSLSLHPVILLPTSVTDTSSTLIDNFLCDFSLLPILFYVDHFMIALKINICSSNGKFVKRNFSLINKSTFTTKLYAANWELLYTIDDTDKAFNYFLRKLKRIYNKSFPFKVFSVQRNKSPWLPLAISKSIRYKNTLFRNMGSNIVLQREYRNYRNQLTKITRAAKYNYNKNLLFTFKNNSFKLWSHLNSLITFTKTKSVSLEPNDLNDIFTSVFRQAPPYNAADQFTVSEHSFVYHSMFLFPVTANEIIITLDNRWLSYSNSIGTDGLSPQIIETNAPFLAHQLVHV